MKQKKEEQARQELVDLGASTTKTARGTIYTLTIIGQIEGHQALPENIKTTKYEHVIPLLAAVEESEEIDGLLLLLNTVGGDIEAGLAIAELIAGMKKPTVSLVLGGGHSIGIPLAVSAKKKPDCPNSQHDRASGAHDGACGRCAANVSVFQSDPGADREFCDKEFAYFP